MDHTGTWRARFSRGRIGCLCLLLCHSFNLYAQGHGLEVRPANQELLSMEPRQPVTTAFQVRNGTGRAGQFEARVVLPEGWRLITPQFPFELSSEQTAIRFISFVIPFDAPSGDYQVAYEVNDRQQPAWRESYALPVRVLPVLSLRASTLDSPEFVVAGEPYRTVFAVRNGGNSPLIVDYRLNSSLNNPLEPNAGTLELKSGESKRLEVTVKTAVSSKPEQEILTLIANARGGEVGDRTTSSIKVLPRVSGIEQRYHTIPSVLRLRGTLRDEKGNQDFGWQAELAGAGTIDSAGKRNVEFLLRGPDLRERVIMGTYDEYRGRYWDDRLSLSLGDWVYSLSPLTENGRYGRGGRAAYRGDRWSLETYYMYDRFGRKLNQLADNPLLRFVDPLDRPRINTEPVEQTAVNGSYLLTPNIRLGANYLGSDTGFRTDIFSLRGQFNWQSKFDLDLEAARSDDGEKDGYALRAHVSDERHPFRYRGVIVHADPDYRGYYRDEEFAFLGFDYPLTERWNVQGSYNRQRNNLDKDPTRVARDQQQVLMGTDYRLSPETRIGLNYRLRDQRDRRSAPDFDSTHHGVGLSLGQQFKGVSLYMGSEWGITEDHRPGQGRFATQFYYGSAHWQATERQSYSAYVFYDDNTYAPTRQTAQASIGANASYRIGRSTAVNLNVLRNQSGKNDHYIFNAGLRHKLDNGHEIWLDGRYSTGAEGRADVMLTYSIPFGVPVGRKKDVATLRGRIYDELTGQGLADIVLDLGGLVAVSKDNGEFIFPSVKLGSYYLSVQNGEAAPGKVPVTKFPMEIEVRSDSENQVEIAMIQAVTLNGCVAVYEDAGQSLPAQHYLREGVVSDHSPANDRSERVLRRTHGLRNVLVVMHNNDQIYKRLTNAEGCFRLAGMPPGTWTVEIAEDGLPANYGPEKRQFEVDLRPGDAASVEYKIVPKIRRIKMLQPLESVALQR
jgi:hypothetical protein